MGRNKKTFCMKDPYNPENTVKGIILNDSDYSTRRRKGIIASLRSIFSSLRIFFTNPKTPGKHYGDLLITHVNNRRVKQYVRCTPKFLYPGNRESPRATFKPEDFPDTPFSVFEKLDGTNIFMFKYVDSNGKEFTSFKTRLVPFLRAEGFKDWIALFKQVTDERPDVIYQAQKIPFGSAFELYGYINEILVKYDVALDIRYLYSVSADGRLFYLGNGKPIFSGKGKKEAFESYNKFVSEAEILFKEGKRAEGFMFYFQNGTVYKCKPVCVVEEQSASPFIGNDDIYTTAMNASESINTIDELLDMTRLLLAETYEVQKIERSEPRILVIVDKAKEYLLIQHEALNVMKELGFAWREENKTMIMRAVMQRFPKKMSAKIYGMLSGKKPEKHS